MYDLAHISSDETPFYEDPHPQRAEPRKMHDVERISSCEALTLARSHAA